MIGVAQPIDYVALQKRLLSRADRLRTYIRGKIPAKFRGQVTEEDILQEVWIAAFRSASSFRGNEDDFDRWMTTITNRKLLDFLKAALAQKRGGTTPVIGQTQVCRSSIADLIARVASPQATPSRVTSSKEATDAVLIALTSLSDDSGRAVRMRHIDGLSLAEIARLMQRTVPAVRSLLFRGLRELRSQLGSAEKFFSDVRPPEDECLEAEGLQPRSERH